MTEKDDAVIGRQDFAPKNTLSKRGRLFGQTRRAWPCSRSTSTIFVVTQAQEKKDYKGIFNQKAAWKAEISPLDK